jgi:hypothetical protein
MIFGCQRIRKAASSIENSQILRTRESSFPRPSTRGLSQAHTSHATLRTARGSFWVMWDGGEPVISCFHHPIDCDPSLAELSDLPVGGYAERDKVGEPGFEGRASRTKCPNDLYTSDSQWRRKSVSDFGSWPFTLASRASRHHRLAGNLPQSRRLVLSRTSLLTPN